MEYISHVRLRRTRSNCIEYDLTSNAPAAAASVSTFHANRTATFWGPHTGAGGARQVIGPAWTLWRADDNAMLIAFRRKYPGATVSYA